MLQRWKVSWKENGFVTEVAYLMEGEYSFTEVSSLKEGEWSCYKGGKFNKGRMRSV